MKTHRASFSGSRAIGENQTAPSSPSPSKCEPVYRVKADFDGDGATGTLIGLLIVWIFQESLVYISTVHLE